MFASTSTYVVTMNSDILRHAMSSSPLSIKYIYLVWKRGGINKVSKPLNQVLSTLVDQESAHQIEHDNLNSDGVYTVEEFEVQIMKPESSGGPWKTKGTIRMQTSENALTVQVGYIVKSETLLAVRTAYVQGDDEAARGRGGWIYGSHRRYSYMIQDACTLLIAPTTLLLVNMVGVVARISYAINSGYQS
nr:cleavage and polyadenylation specificity factor subunit 1 isoform X1 [Tanacetum cinerariifolium]